MQQRQYRSAMMRPSDAGVVTCSFDVAVPSGLSKPSMCRSVSTPTSSSGEVSYRTASSRCPPDPSRSSSSGRPSAAAVLAMLLSAAVGDALRTMETLSGDAALRSVSMVGAESAKLLGGLKAVFSSSR